jgi:uncharacterized membrane protein YedE/YeeE
VKVVEASVVQASEVARGGMRLSVEAGRGIDWRVVGAAALLLAAGVVWLERVEDWRQAVFLLLGGALGLVLYHALFGFTGAWRVFIADGRGAGLRAQMLMLAVAVVLFFPALGAGSLFGQKMNGAIFPAGISVAFGAFLFGIGMQLGGGCASGTLFTVGGGSTRMVLTLLFFIIGSAIGAAHFEWWAAQAALPPITLVEALGVVPALAANLAVFAAIAGLSVVIERRRHGKLIEANASRRRGLARFVHGPWPLWWGAVGLALLNFATLVFSGRPWGITSAFALWGSKWALGLGIDAWDWPYWANPLRTDDLFAPISHDMTSVMDIGIVLGALFAAGLAGRFAPVWRIPLRSLVAAIVGGLMLGYGARLAYGCNIGAFFSGVASGSLHGWLWIIAAFFGNLIGVSLRPLFGLEVERLATQKAC